MGNKNCNPRKFNTVKVVYIYSIVAKDNVYISYLLKRSFPIGIFFSR